MNDNFTLIGVSLVMLFAILLAVAAPIGVVLLFALLLAVVAVGVAVWRYFFMIAPTYMQLAAQQPTQQPQANVVGLLPAQRDSFTGYTQRAIDALPLPARDKQMLYEFTLRSDRTLGALMQSEKLPVALSGVTFGALTVTFRLRLREMSRTHLDRLMKSDSLIAQALAVETVRLTQRAGYIDCEVSSPVRVTITSRTLEQFTESTTVAIGLDTELQPAMVDIAQHGLIAAIAPSRRGKTQAIRTMLYLLKRANPDINIVVIAFKTADWAAFGNVAHLIFDANEIGAFTQWMLQTMYARARQPQHDKWIVVFDDLVNLLSTNPTLPDVIKQFASLGAGVGVTTIVSTQFSGKDSGGTATFANATAKLMFKPSSNMQGARDGGFAGLGLDQLSTQKGDALLLVDGDATRIATAMTADSDIQQLDGSKPNPVWLDTTTTTTDNHDQTTTTVASWSINPMEQLIETLDGDLYDIYDFSVGSFTNKAAALRLLGWSNRGENYKKLSELAAYIKNQHDATTTTTTTKNNDDDHDTH